MPWGTGDEGAAVTPASRIPAARPRQDKAEEELLGVDIDVLDGLPPTFRLAKGRKNLANAIARRLATPAGFLADAFGGDADYGFDLRGRLNAALSTQELAAVGAAVEAQCRADERVESASVSVSHDMATSTLSADISLLTAAGPFRLILNISAVTTEILQPE